MSTVNSLAGTVASTARGKPDAFAALSSEEFVKIMFSELTNQDPLKPNDSNALLQQMSSLRSIESNMQLEKQIGALVSQNQFASAGGLVGAYVSGLSEDNHRVQGQVISVSRTATGPVLNLATGWRVPFGQLDEITDPRLLQPPPNPGNTNPPTPTPTPPAAPSDTAPNSPFSGGD